jgi:hypothetical protein
MDPNWLKTQRALFDKAREHLYELLSHKENATDTIAAFQQNGQELLSKEQDLRKKTTATSDPKEKAVLYYQLLSTINLQRENNDLMAITEKYKDDLSHPDFTNAIKAEKIYFTELANYFDKKMHELQEAYLKRSQHLAILEINSPNLALQKLNAQELHDVYLSMHELTRIPLSKDYEAVSAAMAEQSLAEYAVYHDLAQHCKNAIEVADQRKMKKDTEATNKHSNSMQAATSFFAGEKPITLLIKDRTHLEEKKIHVHKELAELKNQMSSGKFDKIKFGKLQFESDLINQALKRIATTQEMIASPLMSAEYLKEKSPVQSELESERKVRFSGPTMPHR